jgi:hypothetical protein
VIADLRLLHSGSCHWYSDTAGPSPQLYRWMNNVIYGIPQRLDVSTATLDGKTSPDPDEEPPDLPITTRCGPFIDFWCIVCLHKFVQIGRIFLARYLHKLRPRVIESRSSKVFNMLRNDEMTLPSYCDDPRFLDCEVDSLTFLTDCGWKLPPQLVHPGQDTDDEVEVIPGGRVRLRVREGAPDRDPGGGRGPQPGFEDPDDPGDPDDPDDPEEEWDDPDDPEEEWDDKATPDFIRDHVGTIHVWCYGLGCYGVGVVNLDSGVYAYHPILQPYLYRFMVLVAAIVAITRAIAAVDPPDIAWTKEKCENVKRLAEERIASLGLRDRVEEARKELVDVMSAVFSLRKLYKRTDEQLRKRHTVQSKAFSGVRQKGEGLRHYKHSSRLMSVSSQQLFKRPQLRKENHGATSGKPSFTPFWMATRRSVSSCT